MVPVYHWVLALAFIPNGSGTPTYYEKVHVYGENLPSCLAAADAYNAKHIATEVDGGYKTAMCHGDNQSPLEYINAPKQVAGYAGPIPPTSSGQYYSGYVSNGGDRTYFTGRIDD